ncbi:MAG: hypothetical protein RLZZ361_734 [Cyanobacteriota bacterium]|jgi:predicted deacylase
MTTLVINKTKIYPGERKRLSLNISKLYDLTQMDIPVEVIRGEEPGPIMFTTAALHGDEINGVEIIAKLLQTKELKKIKGTLIAVPILNVFGFNSCSRYLPDRRDLNRSFPGTGKGSLAAQIANVFMEEIASQCTHGIDLHSAAANRENLPQIRATFGDHPDLKQLANAFGAPVVIDSKAKEGTLRAAVKTHKIAYMVYEGGRALRFHPKITSTGLNGILNVMREIKMLEKKSKRKKSKSIIANSSSWLRAPESGIIQTKKSLGKKVKKGEVVATLISAFGDVHQEIIADKPGIIIGATILPLVNKGDAVFHIASFDDVDHAHNIVSSYIIDDDVI